MANPANNPLFKHFRQPSIYLRLPSRGRFYPDESINFPSVGEIPVYPMTVKDELMLKTPDALMNGQGMVDVIHSCCPNIIDPWDIPSIDMDAIFIAIRIASYGEGMDIKTTCPHCKTVNENTVDLRVLLDNLKPSDYTNTMSIDNLTIKFKPQNYKAINQTNIITFEEQRLINDIISNPDMSDEQKSALFKTSFNKLNQLNISAIVANIYSITTEDGDVVSDSAQIGEFLENCSRDTYTKIKEFIYQMVELNKTEPIKLVCDECETEYTNQLTFDPSNFFG